MRERTQEHQTQASLSGGILAPLPKDCQVEDEEDSDGSLPSLCDDSSNAEVDGPANTTDNENDDDEDTGLEQEFDGLVVRLHAMRYEQRPSH